MNGERAAAGTAAAASGPAALAGTGSIELGPAWPHGQGRRSHAMLLAALAGALAVTCISAVLVLMSPVPTGQQRAIDDGRQVLSYLLEGLRE